jgi:hypothetical protein
LNSINAFVFAFFPALFLVFARRALFDDVSVVPLLRDLSRFAPEDNKRRRADFVEGG